MKVKAYTVGTASSSMKHEMLKNYNYDFLMVCPNCKMLLPANKSMKYCHWCGTKLELDEIKDYVKEGWIDEL